MPIDPGDAARRALLELEKRKQLAVLSEFQKIQDRLSSQLADVLDQIEKERRIEGNASPALLFQKGRIVDLLDNVKSEIETAALKLSYLTKTAQSQAIDVAQNQAGKYPEIKSDLGMFDAPATRELIGIAGNGQPLALHFAMLAEPAKQAMFDALFYGIAAGRSNQEITREVKDAIGGTTVRAMTIVRTETNRAYREASRKFYIETPGITGWRWLAALDLRTCLICWALHGHIFQTKTKFGTHPNCRCTMVPVFKTDDRSLIIKGPETFARLTEAQQKTILGPRRFDLYYQGADLPDFVDTTRTPFGIGRVIKPLDRTTFAPNPRSRIREPIEPLKPSTPKTTSVDRSTPKTTSPAAKPIKPGSPVPSFTSAAHAAEYMERRFPGRLFDYSGMDLQLIQTNTAEMARLMDLYPKVADRLNYIGNNFDLAKLRSTGIDGKMRKSWNAMHSRMTRNPADPNYKSAIVYNSKVYDNARQFQDNKAYAKRIGWTVSDRDYSTSTHEFGHAVDYWVDSMSTSSPFHFAFADGRSEIGTIKAEIVKQLKPKYGELSAYGIKGRGETQRREQFAEGFSMLHNEPRATWPKFVQAMDVLLKRIMEKPVFAYDEVNEFRDLDEAGKTAARAEYNAFMKELGLKIKRL